MSQVMSPWFSVGPKDELKTFQRPTLKRKEHKWDSPVSFPCLEKSIYSTKDSVTDVCPVMPDIHIGGKPGLVPMTMGGFQIDAFKGKVNPEAFDDEGNDSYNTSYSEVPWNLEMISTEKSLYRVIITHNFSKNEYVKPRGLYNTRNMCFFNSVLQVLVHCSPLNALIKDITENVPLKIFDTKTPVLNALIRFFYNYADWTENRKAISGEAFYDVICDKPPFHVERDRQEDSQEFLSDLLDVLETNFRHAPPTDEDERDDLIGAKRQAIANAVSSDNGWTEVGHKSKAVETQHAGHQDLDNPIEELFGGRFKSVLIKKGGKPSVTTEPFQQVPVDISAPGIYSVQRAFEEMFAEEHLVLGSTPATKRLELDLLPHILIVHLKRFTFIRHGESFEFGKITKPIMIEDTLKMNCNGQGLVSYTPIGVIYHHGTSATRGHYTADVKVKDQWYSIDDEQVVPVQGSEVLGRDVSGGGGSRSAYMIFYERK